MANRRVFITGLGVITPIGVGADALWAGLRRGTSAVSEVTRFDPTPFRSRIAAEVRDLHPTDHIATRRARRLDRYTPCSVSRFCARTPSTATCKSCCCPRAVPSPP